MKFLFSTILVLSFSLTTLVHSDETKPNIVFMFADDLGFGDLGCYGHPYANTPNLDQLASEGTRFTQFYVTGVTCNPSRTGLMTGIHPARYQKYSADFGFQDRISITEMLRDHGYRTGHFGKWHIGPDEENGTYGLEQIEIIGGDHEDPEGRDTKLYQAAEQFIRDHEDEPFYVNIWGHSTHFPVHTTPSLAETFGEIEVDRSDFSEAMQTKFDESEDIDTDLDASMHQYLADVYSLDLNVGRILRTLDELGIADNTIVVFSSDHGPAPVVLGNKGVREFSKNMLGYAGVHRGGKHTHFEGGTRVPFIIRWPGQVSAGRIDEESVCSFIDWMPTLAAITGIDELPEQLDGEDTSDIWRGQSRERTTALFWKPSSIRSSPAMRMGDWKIHLPRKRNATVELYDLATDPAESRNLAEQKPEVVAKLRSQLESWVDELPKSYEEQKGKKN